MQTVATPPLFTGFRADFFEHRAKDFLQKNPIHREDRQEFLEKLALYMQKSSRLLLANAALIQGDIPENFYDSDFALEIDPRLMEGSAEACEQLGPIVLSFLTWNFSNHTYILEDLLNCCCEYSTKYSRSGLRCVPRK